VKEQNVAKKRINGEGTVWYVPSKSGIELSCVGIKERQPHDARHTFATVLLRIGTKVKVVSYYLDPSDVRSSKVGFLMY
jgi:integrase